MLTVISIINTKKIPKKKIHKSKSGRIKTVCYKKSNETKKVSVNEGNEGEKGIRTFRKESLQNGRSPSISVIIF